MLLVISLFLQFWFAFAFIPQWRKEAKLLTGIHRRIANGTLWVVIAGAIPYILVIGSL
jgi:hypothetical protein